MEWISCRLDAICSGEGQRLLDELPESLTNMKHRLLIRWLLQVDLDGSSYLRKTHAAGESSSISDVLC